MNESFFLMCGIAAGGLIAGFAFGALHERSRQNAQDDRARRQGAQMMAAIIQRASHPRRRPTVLDAEYLEEKQ